MSGYQSGNMAGEMWVQWFSCCVNQPAAQRVSHSVIYTASFCAVDHHDKPHFTEHCFHFATTFTAVSFFMLVLFAGAITFMCIWDFYTCIHLKILFLKSC
jgi:hypothetical protein